jgi:hypothetical protein
MFNTHRAPSSRPNPLKTLLGVIGIAIGAVFFLQASNVIPFSFDMTNALYIKVFATYAILSGLVLVIHISHYGVIRY